MHDQTLHYANMGYTMNELPDLVTFSLSPVIANGAAEVWAANGRGPRLASCPRVLECS
jgi:hypothetical protein